MSDERFTDEAQWQDAGGYARAARRGRRIADQRHHVVGPDGGVLHPGDSHGQAAEAIGRAVRGVEALGGTAADVLRTRIYLTPTPRGRTPPAPTGRRSAR